jgi:hypothetical protein|tara:strand:- start:37 stop:768 length:732 start_codon:yes stop_codon:yes gene_type:complete
MIKSDDRVHYKMQVLPAVYVLETQMPQKMVDDVNDYMDEYREDKNKQSLASTLVGQIDKGEQLLLDHNDKRMVEYNNFICSLSAEYINNFAAAGNPLKCAKKVEIDETWSVHSYDGDYNPIHDHGTKTLMGISTTAWTKVPSQIGAKAIANSPSYSLYNESGHSDGCISFQYGRVSVLDSERLAPAQSFVMTPEVGKLLIFPSWLQHMVYPFKGDGERRTIASNLNCWDIIDNQVQITTKENT